MTIKHGPARSVAILATSCSMVAANAALQARQLNISVTHEVQCSRQTRVGDSISVHYNGTLTDGTLFDSSRSRNSPIVFTLGIGQVIPGWDQGLLGMCIGEERLLSIPSALAYGSRGVGAIPPDSTLIFETLLVDIAGVDVEANQQDVTHMDEQPEKEGDAWQEDDEEDAGDPTDFSIQTAAAVDPAIAAATRVSAHLVPSSSAAKAAEAVSTQQPISPTPEDPDPSHGKSPPDNTECRLLGPFALFVQGGLGILAISSLVWKRYRERPRRPFKVWFFDASKQVFGSALLHVLNLTLSILASTDAEKTQHMQIFGLPLQAEVNEQVNPCSWYLINIAIDTTIGIPILVISLKLLYHAFALTPLARPLESIRSGNYGQPPRIRWWLKQALIYSIGLVLMKICVFLIIQVLPWIALVGDWALRWTEGSEALQVTFVMFVFPLIMNALQYYIIDSFIKDGSAGHDAVPSDDESTGTQPSYHSIDPRDSFDSVDDNAVEAAAKENDEHNLTSPSSSDERRAGRKGEDDHLRKDI